MAGHSKWANIKHKKAKTDAQKGNRFTKISREITVAVKHGGEDPEANIRLRMAIQKAKEANMPNDNIQRAIHKGTGENSSQDYEEVVYEGYGPGGFAVYLEIVTDNRNRTAGEIRNIFSKRGGNLGESGCVSWMFEKKSIFVLNGLDKTTDENDVFEAAVNAGADDLYSNDGQFEVSGSPEKFEAIKTALSKSDLEPSYSEIGYVPKNTIKLKDETARQALELLEALENHDDVQNVYANADISDEAAS